MKTLVTGGAGFIGSHLVDRLASDGDGIDILDDLSTGRADNLSQQGDNPRVRLVEGSILDEAAVEDLVSACDRVFHLAAAVGVAHIINDPLGSLLVNSRGTENVLAACARHGRKVLIASSSEVYGKTERIPMHEDDDRILGSTTVHRWSYATAKALDEHLAFAYARTGLHAVVVRYFNIYGARMDPRGYASVMANFLEQATSDQPVTVYGDGLQRRCFTYVDDCVEGTVLAMETQSARARAFNIGDPSSETTILDLARMVVEATGSASPISQLTYEARFGPGFEDTRRRVPAVDRARDQLGWAPRVGLAEGLRRTIAALSPA